MSTSEGRPRACTNCARSKLKCVWLETSNETSSVCERCSNNNFLCSKLGPAPRRGRGKATHSKVLEQKLDDIMAFLNRDRERSSHLTQSPRHDPAIDSIQESHQHHASNSPSQSLPASSHLHNDTIDIVPGFQLSASEANQAIQDYMKEMLPQFPFVPINTPSALEMYRDHPLLLKTVLWATRPPGSEEFVAFETWFRRHIAHQTVVLMKNNIDIIQSILVFLAWLNDIYLFAQHKHTALLQIAIGLVEDLALHEPPDKRGLSSGSVVEDAADLRNDLPPRAQQTQQDRRTVLGVYYITSVLLGQRSRLDYAPHFDHCCSQLLLYPEYVTDSLLVHLIRIRQIAVKVNDGFGKNHEVAKEESFRNMHALAVSSVRKELDTFMDQLPDHLRENHLLRNHYAAIRIRLFEPTVLRNVSSNNKSEALRLSGQTLWDCLESAQMLSDAFLSMAAPEYPPLTFISILHLVLGLIKAIRLLLMENDAWDPETIQAAFNLPRTLLQLAEKFEAVSRVGSPRCKFPINGRSMFSEYAERYRQLEQWFGSEIYTDQVGSAAVDRLFPYSEDELFGFWQQPEERI